MIANQPKVQQVVEILSLGTVEPRPFAGGRSQPQ